MRLSRHQRNRQQQAGRYADSLGDDEIRGALELILKSPEFGGAARIQSFLQYIIDAQLEGRSEEIRAKSIAEDVYGRSLDESGDPMAVVRVDAGRMRRRLAQYYANTGKDANIRIHVDPGGYVPRFECVETGQFAPKVPVNAQRVGLVPVAVLGSLILIGLVAAAILPTGQPDKVSLGANVSAKPEAVREALFSTDPAKLQARNIASEARLLMFPVLDKERLKAVLGMFERAKKLDPDYVGGYAGSAQVFGILAITTPPGDARKQLIVQAAQNADRALEIDSSHSWSQSANAVVAFAQREYAQALTYSARAKDLAPNDTHVLSFDALFALFSGDFERAIDTANRALKYDTGRNRSPFRNVLAAANFHLGNYQGTVDQFNEAIRSGAPVSAISIAYLAAAYQRLGEHERATATILLLKDAQPQLSIAALFKVLFENQQHANAILSALSEIQS